MSIAGLITTFFFFNSSNSLLDQTLEPFSSPNWEDVANRNIIKNSIPIVLLDTVNTIQKCKVLAENFDLIISHKYFVRANQLVDELEYNSDEKTLSILCDKLMGEKSTLHVWYATKEAKKHPTKYEYFITESIEDIQKFD